MPNHRIHSRPMSVRRREGLGMVALPERPTTVVPLPAAPHRRHRRMLVWLFAVAAIAVLAGAAFVSGRHEVHALTAQVVVELRAGQADLESGKARLKLAQSQHKPELIQQASADFQTARRHFAAARGVVDRSTLLGLASDIPVVGSYARSRKAAVDAVSDMGIALSDGAGKAADVDLLLTRPTPGQGGAPHLLAVLNQAQPLLRGIVDDLKHAQADANAVDVRVLPVGQQATLASAKHTIATGLAGLTEFQRLAPVITEILGGNGPRTYLIEQVNPAELRAGGGFIGTVSLVRADHGKLTIQFSGDTATFDGFPLGAQPWQGAPGYVAPPNTFTGFYQGKSWILQDSAFFPAFSSNAYWGETFAAKVRQVHPDGVIALDYYAIQSMLAVTGPITVPEFGVTFDSKNFADAVFQRSLVRDPTHKTVLAATAVPFIDKLSSLPADRWPDLVKVMNEAAGSRHLQAYFNSQPAEAEMSRIGWSGQLNPLGVQDFLFETEDNMGGSKANHFVVRHYGLTLSQVGGVLHHHVVLDIQDNTPPIAIYGPEYYTYVRFYTGASASNLHLTPQSSEYRSTIPADYRNSDIPPGYKLTDGWIFIDVGYGLSGHFRLVFDYDTPWTADTGGVHTMYWQKQPGIPGDRIDISWKINGATHSASATLDVDRVITLKPNGLTIDPGQPATAHLPGLSL